MSPSWNGTSVWDWSRANCRSRRRSSLVGVAMVRSPGRDLVPVIRPLVERGQRTAGEGPVPRRQNPLRSYAQPSPSVPRLLCGGADCATSGLSALPPLGALRNLDDAGAAHASAADRMLVARLYQPASRAIGSPMVLTGLPGVRSVTRIDDA
jgi:hypothetical protein